MLFTAALREKIIRGEKIQTRRPVKEGETYDPLRDCVFKGKRQWIANGYEYGVQYGRAKPTVWYRRFRRGELPMEYEIISWEKYARLSEEFGKEIVKLRLRQNGYKPLRILITDIRRVDVREISHEDAVDEGFQSEAEFLLTWCGFYDKRIAGLTQKDGVVLWVDGAGNPYASDVVYMGS